MKAISMAQERVLMHFAWGGSVTDPRRTFAPIRRLIARGLIEPIGHLAGRQHWKISEAGLRALSQSKDPYRRAAAFIKSQGAKP